MHSRSSPPQSPSKLDPFDQNRAAATSDKRDKYELICSFMTSSVIPQLSWMAEQGGSDFKTASTQSTRHPKHRGRYSFRAVVALLTEETTCVWQDLSAI